MVHSKDITQNLRVTIAVGILGALIFLIPLSAKADEQEKLPPKLDYCLKELERAYYRNDYSQMIYILNKIKYEKFSDTELDMSSEILLEKTGKTLFQLVEIAINDCSVCKGKEFVTCPTCKGEGWVYGEGSTKLRYQRSQCKNCNKEGKVRCLVCYKRRYSKENKLLLQYYKNLFLNESETQEALKAGVPKQVGIPEKSTDLRKIISTIPFSGQLNVDKKLSEWDKIPVLFEDEDKEDAHSGSSVNIKKIKMAHNDSHLFILIELVQFVDYYFYINCGSGLQIATFIFDTDNNNMTGGDYDRVKLKGFEGIMAVWSGVEYRGNAVIGRGSLPQIPKDKDKLKSFIYYIVSKYEKHNPSPYISLYNRSTKERRSDRNDTLVNYIDNFIELKVNLRDMWIDFENSKTVRIIFIEEGKGPSAYEEIIGNFKGEEK